MKVAIIGRLTDPPLRLEGRTIIVEDTYGNPLVVVQELATTPPACSITTVKDPRFHDVLASLGINKTVIVDEARMTQELPKGHQQLSFDRGLKGF